MGDCSQLLQLGRQVVPGDLRDLHECVVPLFDLASQTRVQSAHFLAVLIVLLGLAQDFELRLGLIQVHDVDQHQAETKHS